MHPIQYTTQHTTQHAAQHAAHNTQHNTQHNTAQQHNTTQRNTTRITKHTTQTQHTTHNTQSQYTTQYATHNTHNTMRNTQHTTQPGRASRQTACGQFAERILRTRLIHPLSCITVLIPRPIPRPFHPIHMHIRATWFRSLNCVTCQTQRPLSRTDASTDREHFCTPPKTPRRPSLSVGARQSLRQSTSIRT